MRQQLFLPNAAEHARWRQHPIGSEERCETLYAFSDYAIEVDVYDPWVSNAEAEQEYGIKLKTDLENSSYDALVLAVAHNQFREMSIADYKKLLKDRKNRSHAFFHHKPPKVLDICQVPVPARLELK